MSVCLCYIWEIDKKWDWWESLFHSCWELFLEPMLLRITIFPMSKSLQILATRWQHMSRKIIESPLQGKLMARARARARATIKNDVFWALLVHDYDFSIWNHGSCDCFIVMDFVLKSLLYSLFISTCFNKSWELFGGEKRHGFYLTKIQMETRWMNTKRANKQQKVFFWKQLSRVDVDWHNKSVFSFDSLRIQPIKVVKFWTKHNTDNNIKVQQANDRECLICLCFL